MLKDNILTFIYILFEKLSNRKYELGSVMINEPIIQIILPFNISIDPGNNSF